jgi:transcription initiation factor TFIIE subunit beta
MWEDRPFWTKVGKLRRRERSLSWQSSTEFKELWHTLKTPDVIDLPAEMRAGKSFVFRTRFRSKIATEGLKVTASAAVTEEDGAGQGTIKKKRKTGNRRVKITNTHIEGVDLTRGALRFSSRLPE